MKLRQDRRLVSDYKGGGNYQVTIKFENFLLNYFVSKGFVDFRHYYWTFSEGYDI